MTFFFRVLVDDKKMCKKYRSKVLMSDEGLLCVFQSEDIPLSDMMYPESGMQSPTSAPMVGSIRHYPTGPGPNPPPVSHAH